MGDKDELKEKEKKDREHGKRQRWWDFLVSFI